jgi:two-component system, cell cycle response regulator
MLSNRIGIGTNVSQSDSPLILVVDDEPMMQLLLLRSLAKAGYRVVQANNGQQGLEIYQQEKPDLVMMDALMPVMDGFTCCQRLRGLPGGASTPVLIVTGLEDPESVDRAFAVGATDYITKPIHWAMLKQRLRRMLEASRAMEELRQRAAREQVLGAMLERIRQSLNLEEILKTTVNEVRQFLLTDRVLIFRFNPDGSKVLVVESVAPGWSSTPTPEISEACFGECLIERYQQGHVQALEDTCGSLHEGQDAFVEHQVNADLVVPIWQEETLWGLLIAYHGRGPRRWQTFEIELVERLATQVAIAIQQAKLYEQLKDANRELHRLASLDGLTQVANRRCFDETLNREWLRLARESKPLSLILLDIDYFKRYNDTYGHQAGDACLQQVTAAVRPVLKRPSDLLARYGGEEFAVILPNTKIAGALFVAEQMQAVVKGLAIPHSQSGIKPYVTLSLGVSSTIPAPNFLPTTLIAAADKALYQAKAAGRDRIWHSHLPCVLG